jgi:alanine racemase
MSEYPYRSWLEVSRRQIAANYQAVRRTVGADVEVMPVVKADAYRHGAIEVSRTLVDEGARWLAVSNVHEGVELRQAGIKSRILVMADFLPFERPALVEYDLTPVIHSLEDVAELDRLAQVIRRPVQYHLKIDSGMGRLGTRAPFERVCEAVQAATHARIEGLMTHLASPADYTTTQTDDQTRYFLQLKSKLQEAGIGLRYFHLSATTPISFDRQDALQNMVRPGHAIYGYVSSARGHAPKSLLDVKPVLTWKVAILEVKDLPEGALVGYGGMFRAPRPTRIAVLAAGYADGLPHRLSNRGTVIAGGKFAPIIGAVSMDLTTIDITDSPQLKPGDAVTLLGSEGDVEQDARDMAKVAGTISYSVLCGIHARVRRVYI